RRYQRRVDLAVRLGRRATDRAHDDVALARHHGEVVRTGHGPALLARPGVHEQLLEVGHDRAVDLQVGVAPRHLLARALLRALAERAARIDAADVDAADERRPAIDDGE